MKSKAPITKNTAMPEYLEVMKSEFYSERGKRQHYDSKSGLLLAFIGVIIIFLFKEINCQTLTDYLKQDQTFLIHMKALLGIIIYLIAAFCLFGIYKVFNVKTCRTLMVTDFTDKHYSNDRYWSLHMLVEGYKNGIKNYRAMNKEIMGWFQKSLNSTLLLVVFVIIYNLL